MKTPISGGAGSAADVVALPRAHTATPPSGMTRFLENERLLAVVESLMEKGEENFTPEEDALLELLTNLIHDFESKHRDGRRDRYDVEHACHGATGCAVRRRARG